MLKISDQAREKVIEFIRSEEEQALALRVGVAATGDFEFGLVKEGDTVDGDAVIDAGGFQVYVDAASAPRLESATFEYVEQGAESGFRVVVPGPTWDDPLAKRVQELIDDRINPGVASHGGHVALVDVKDTRVFIRFSGGCQGCGMAGQTLKLGIERMIRESIPEVTEIVDATDHALGESPYYAPAGEAGPGETPLG